MCTTYLMHGSRVFLLGNILILILTAKPCKNKNVDAKIPIGHSSDLVGLVGPGHWSRAGRSRTANLENQYRPQNCSASSSYSALNCEIRAIHVITRIDHQLASLCPFQENWLPVVRRGGHTSKILSLTEWGGLANGELWYSKSFSLPSFPCF